MEAELKCVWLAMRAQTQANWHMAEALLLATRAQFAPGAALLARRRPRSRQCSLSHGKQVGCRVGWILHAEGGGHRHDP